MAKSNWFQKGKEGAERAKKVDAETKARREQRGPMRFWLDYDSSAKVTFLDTPEFFCWEHNLKLQGRYNNFFTCLRDFDTCPLDESGDNPSYICVGTVISHKKWKDSDGNTHQNQKMLFVAKGRARQRLLKQIERRDDDLRFCVYEMARGTTTTEASVGEDFEFLKRINKKQLKTLLKKTGGVPDDVDVDEYLEPFDYEKIFAPKTPKELRAIVGGDAPVGSEDEEEEDTKKASKSSKKVNLDALEEELEDMSKSELGDKAEELEDQHDIKIGIKTKDKIRDRIDKIMSAMKKLTKGGSKDDDDDDEGASATSIDDLL